MNEVELNRLEDFAHKVGLRNIVIFLQKTKWPKGLTEEYAIYFRDLWVALLNNWLKHNKKLCNDAKLKALPELDLSVGKDYNPHFIVFDRVHDKNMLTLLYIARHYYNCTFEYPIEEHVEVLKACLEGKDWFPLFELMKADHIIDLKKRKKYSEIARMGEYR